MDDRSWLHPDVEVAPSPVAGLGLFATAPIPAGTVVERLGGEVIDDARLAALTPPYSSLTVAEGTHLLIDPDHPVRYGNHSCDPNLWHTDATTITTRRDIPLGAELLIDYATHTGQETWRMHCTCPSPLCRREITGTDWRSPTLRTRYSGHWSPVLLARFR
ncbi:SET domain-containing protein [Actinokineospora terrae]|uniref:SET domain-containing protein n=1 Tax=Actinokineospora terrae TaxID=155974 RepID=A0A1H9WZ24_9PSEU|nr:SET domain-containing protein [Actinokineospora terrae]SES39079.1 hypothetical protein SAMN04487818_11223 [Actinokineospora terrae]